MGDTLSSNHLNKTRPPYYRLSAFYLVYFASVGAFVPYWSVYLQSLDFSPGQIGELIAISLITKVFAPYFWGWVADHTGHRLRVIRWTSFLTAAGFFGVFADQSYGWLMLVISIYSFFWHAVLPQFEVTTINYLGTERVRYSRIRLWGSVGFIVAVMGLGYLFEQFGVGLLPYVISFLVVAIWLVTFLIRHSPESASGLPHVSIIRVISNPKVLAFFLACFLIQASHGPYYAFFSIYLEAHGYTPSQIGQLWALGVIAEIAVFLLMHRWLHGIGAIRLFQLAILITALRWVLIGAGVDVLFILLVAQLMHAASYGLYHASAIELVNDYFPGKLQGRGQALYSSISFGLGNALGSLAAGYMWTSISPQSTYYLAAVLCLLGFFVALYLSKTGGDRPHSHP